MSVARGKFGGFIVFNSHGVDKQGHFGSDVARAFRCEDITEASIAMTNRTIVNWDGKFGAYGVEVNLLISPSDFDSE